MPSVTVRAITLTCVVVLALLFGGGGRPAPLAGFVVQFAAVAACLAWLWLPSMRRVAPTTGAITVAALVAIVPLLHLVPLPPSIWQSLPGRGIESEILGIVGAQGAWRPLSMAPSRTLAALLSLAPPLLVLLLASTLNRREQWLPLAGVAIVALLSAVLGALQLAAPASKLLHFYGSSNVKWVLGFQANRNAEVDILLIGIAATAALLLIFRRDAGRGHAGNRTPLTLVVGLAVICVLALGAVMTGSRAGLALLVLVAGTAAVMLGVRRLPRPLLLAISVGVLMLGGLFAWLATRTQGGLSRVAGRFQGFQDFRSELWTDTWLAIGQHWPWGSGMGTFQPLMIAVERLEVVDRTLPVRAHNDYLELALEAGLPGMIAWGLAALTVLFFLVRNVRRRVPEDGPALAFTAIAIAVIALHSLVDYPLRSISLACLLGLASGFVLVASRPSDSPPRHMKRGSSCPS